jgi:ABC-type sugar transport system permease subunit
VTHPSVTAPPKRARLWQQLLRHKWGYVFVAPWILLFVVFGLYPLALSFYLTFFDYSFTNPERLTFVGIGNWLRGLSDRLFWLALVNIVYNQAVFIVLKNGLGLATALLLKEARVLGRFFRTLYFMPVVTSVVVLMTIGGYLASPRGPLQSLLIDGGVLQSPVYWQFTTWLPMPVIALINTWKWFGISTVILLAGLYSIDKQLYEAADIDGASAWQKFRFITWPQLHPQIFFLLVIDLINGLQMFTEVFMVFDLYGGQRNQALTPVLYLYAQAFDRSNIGYASVLGLLLAGIIAVGTWLQFKFFRRDVS